VLRISFVFGLEKVATNERPALVAFWELKIAFFHAIHVTNPARDWYNLNHSTFQITTFLASSGKITTFLASSG